MAIFTSQIESPSQPATGIHDFVKALSATTVANALIGFIFAASGPVAVILAVGTQGGLESAALASWIFGSFFINGLLTIAACWIYRTPLVFFLSLIHI